MARATLADLYAYGLKASALENTPVPEQEKALDGASGMVDTYLRSRHKLPLVQPYPTEIIRAESVLAAWDLITTRGHQASGFDESLERRWLATLEWLKDLSAGRASLAMEADSTPTISEGAPGVVCYSTQSYGW